MRTQVRRCLWILVIVCSAYVGLQLTRAARAALPTPPDPAPERVAVHPAAVSLGAVPLGEHRRTQVALENVSPNSQTITQVRTSCGCTAALPQRQEFGPGQTIQVDIDFAARTPGPFSKSVRLHFASGALVTAQVTGEVVPPSRP